MSISWGTQYGKLKTNLRLSINRLKLMQKKKTEMAMKARTEIADFISANKADRARIRVEHIIREDFLVEAFELIEMYCDLLLARFGLIEQMKNLDDGIAEAVISILWAAPRIAQDITEFKTISDQLTIKYGKPLAEAARGNQLEFPARVAPKLVAKLSVTAPPKLLVERYMIEIAAAAGIPFTPDADVMREDEVAQAEKMLIDFKAHQPAPVANGEYGWTVSGGAGAPPPAIPPFIPPPSNFPGFPPHGGGGGGIGEIYEIPSRGENNSRHVYDDPAGQQPSSDASLPPGMIHLPRIGGDGRPQVSGAYPVLSARNSVVEDKKGMPSPTAPNASDRKYQDSIDELSFPEPPSTIPHDSYPGGGSGGAGLDLDDLTRRFDALTKKP